jgi:hypothetical protein
LIEVIAKSRYVIWPDIFQKVEMIVKKTETMTKASEIFISRRDPVDETQK